MIPFFLIWLSLLVGVLRAGRGATRSARSNPIYMTIILAALTALQLYGQSR